MDALNKSIQWITEQLVTIGSSGSGVVANESPYKTSAELYDEMVAAEEGTIYSNMLNDDMRRGILTEPLHRILLEQDLGVTVEDHDQDQFLYNPKYPWAHALPDGWTLYEGERIPVQLKHPRVRSWYELRIKGIHGYWWLGCQHSMAVCDTQVEYFSVLNSETMRLIHFPVERDDATIENLMHIEECFYQMFKERKRPAEKEEKMMDLPEVNSKLLVLDGEDNRILSENYKDAKALLEDAQIIVDVAKVKIIDAMENYEVAELPGLRVYNKMSKGRRSVDKKAMQRDGIDLSKYEKFGKPYSSFRAYNLGK